MKQALFRVCLLCCCALNISASSAYRAVVGERIFVANSESATVSVLRATPCLPAINGTAQVGKGPSGVAVGPNGTRVYVTNYDADSVSVLDPGTTTVVATITVGAKPFAIALNSSGTRAYVTNSGANTVSVLDLTTNSVAATITVGASPLGV